MLEVKMFLTQHAVIAAARGRHGGVGAGDRERGALESRRLTLFER